MICRKCHNQGFVPTEEIRHPLKNMGNKVHLQNVNLRYYVCMQCGYTFQTKEEWYRDVEVKGSKLKFEGEAQSPTQKRDGTGPVSTRGERADR